MQTRVFFRLSIDEITWSRWSVTQPKQRAFSRSTHTHGSEPDYSFVFQQDGFWHTSMFVLVIIISAQAEAGSANWEKTKQNKAERILLCYCLAHCSVKSKNKLTLKLYLKKSFKKNFTISSTDQIQIFKIEIKNFFQY